MILFALLVQACDADCDDPARLNGSYAVFHDVLNATGDAPTGDTGGGDTAADAAKDAGGATASGYDGYTYAVFANGWSHWNLTWSQSTGKLKIAASDAKERMGDPAEVDGQAFTWSGDLVEQDGNCNAFDLTLTGQYTSSDEAVHSFEYQAELSWKGTGLAGTYTYTDGFTTPGGAAGSISNAKGDVIFVAQTGDSFDTGF